VAGSGPPKNRFVTKNSIFSKNSLVTMATVGGPPSVSIATENPKTYTRSDITLAPTPKFPLARKVLSHRVAGSQKFLCSGPSEVPIGQNRHYDTPKDAP
jgi:hypothetical protein